MEKKSNTGLIIGIIVGVLVLLFIIGFIVAFIFLGFTFSFYTNKVTEVNKNINTKKVLQEKRADEATKSYLASLVGLTINGFPKMSNTEAAEVVEDYDATKTYADVSGPTLGNFFLSLDESKTYYLKNLDSDQLLNLIYGYALKFNKLGSVSGSEYSYCEAGSGSCPSITKNIYRDIANLYNLNKDGDYLFDSTHIYGNQYLFDNGGWIIEPIEIKDSVSFEENKDSTVLIYSVVYTRDTMDGYKTYNKTYKFTFKEGNMLDYYLDNVVVVNK